MFSLWEGTIKATANSNPNTTNIVPVSEDTTQLEYHTNNGKRTNPVNMPDTINSSVSSPNLWNKIINGRVSINNPIKYLIPIIPKTAKSTAEITKIIKAIDNFLPCNFTTFNAVYFNTVVIILQWNAGADELLLIIC